MAETQPVTDDLAAEDPTYRIGRLEAAQRPPVRVAPDASVERAVTIMLSKDFSQLPVMTSERCVKGIISWNTIGSKAMLAGHDAVNHARVQNLMDTHHEVSSESSLFGAILSIVQNQYVLIRGSDRRITGIVTVSDLSLQLQQLTEPFLPATRGRLSLWSRINAFVEYQPEGRPSWLNARSNHQRSKRKRGRKHAPRPRSFPRLREERRRRSEQLPGLSPNALR
jgi:predicted transcriptional regulator